MNVRGLWARPFDGARTWRYHGIVEVSKNTVTTLCGMRFGFPWWHKVRIPKRACKHCLNKLRRDPQAADLLLAAREAVEKNPKLVILPVRAR